RSIVELRIVVGGVALADHAPDERLVAGFDLPAECLGPPVGERVGVGAVLGHLKVVCHEQDGTGNCGQGRSSTSGRILAVLDTSAGLRGLLSLRPTRPAWTGPELAERLDVTVRTLRRDMVRLRDLGYPVGSAPGVAGGYRLAAGSTLPPLL